MSQRLELSSQIMIRVNGADVPRNVMLHLVEVEVDQHAYMPSMATLQLNDPELKLLDKGPFNLACALHIAAESENGDKVTLFDGEITALEPAFNRGMNATLVVRAFDHLHRLYRQTSSAGHQNIKDSDLAKTIAAAAGLKANVDATATVYEHLAQYNQSDLCFLQQRAARIGYECFISGGVLYFRKPGSDSSLRALTWGRDLLEFAPRMTLAHQVDEVLVKGWDRQKKTAIVGRAAAGGRYARITEPKDGAAWAQEFGPGRLVIVDAPVVSQAEADVLAAARLDAISAGFVAGDGEAYRRPDLQPGRLVELRALGERFSGRYWLAAVRHSYDSQGLTARFAVCGAHLGLWEAIDAFSSVERWGPATAIVTNTDDPEDCGRVRVKFPWLADDVESGWARVIGAGAGPGAGFYAMPEVGDEVVVTFLHGDANHPVVLGGLWNGQDKVPEEVAQGERGRRPGVRTWRSRRGHRITCDDTKNSMVLTTARGHSIRLDDNSGDVEVFSKGNLTLKADKKVEIRGQSIHLN